MARKPAAAHLVFAISRHHAVHYNNIYTTAECELATTFDKSTQPVPVITATPEVARDSSEAVAESAGSRVRLGALAVMSLSYAALSQYSASYSNPHSRSLGAALSIAPVMLIGLWMLWYWKWRFTALAVAVVTSGLLYRAWPAVEAHYQWADLAQQCGIYGLVAVLFARSLLANRVPICTLLAQQMHGTLTPVEVAYMRGATAAWAIFYVILAVTILGLFFTASLRVWSLFVNFAAWGLMALAGLIDHVVRCLVLPTHREVGILAIIRRALRA